MEMKNLVIANPKYLENKKKIFRKDGKEKIHVLTDFDRSLTKAYVEGEYVPSVISILRSEGYISEDYTKKANALAAKYHPIELDSKIPVKEKKKQMMEWWTKHFKLLIESKLNKKHLEKIIQSDKIWFREGALEFIDLTHKYGIPFVIMSSSGVGDTLPMIFEREKRLYDNIHIITNLFKWDKKGYAKEVIKPIIHSLNKDETMLQDYSFFKEIKNRKNVVLLGDNVEDIEMVKGFDYDNIIKIGFLNKDVEKNIGNYKKAFDIVILNDSNMNYVNSLMKEIVK